MSNKNLTFKLVMDADTKGFVKNAKNAEKAFDDLQQAVSQGAVSFERESKRTSEAIGNIIPKNASERANTLTKSLNETTEIIKSTGADAVGASESFSKFGVDSVRSLNLLKANLATAKKKLEEFSKTNATPEDILKAQQQINALEKEVQQADLAFGAFKAELNLITPEIKKVNTGLSATGSELGDIEDLANKANDGIQGLKTSYTALTGAMAALGIGVTGKELAETADAFKSLEARISLSVGASGNLEQALKGVQKIAIETRSNLVATGELFSRVNTAVKDLGYTQEKALGITRLINQAMIVGGGSAASNEAAITQLNQAFQSGVLRGEEFNSMMEQSPRLSKALADGLGVSIGKLREMANTGQLTTNVVIKALQSQAKAVEGEFAKMPITIGQSIENLKTSWMLYIGELDKTHGISERVAESIKYVADNLDQLVSTLTFAAQAFIAYKALNIASVFLDKAAGVRAASTAIAQETTVVVANTQAQIANAAATRGAATAKTQLAANSAAASTSMAATGGSVMTLIGRLGALGIAVTAIGVLIPTVAVPLGTAIGEGLAKSVEKAEMAFSNLGKASEDKRYLTAIQELESATKTEAAQAKVAAEIKAEQAAAAEKARDKTYQLTEESKKSAAEFDELIKKGEPTKEALEKISNAMKFDSTKGINDSVTALILLQEQGKITSEELQLSLSQALDGKDLLVFETNAKAAFAGIAKEAEKTAALTEAVMKAALSRTGLDTEQLKGRFSETFKSASNDVQIVIDNLEAYKAQGIDTGLALSANLNKAIDTAQTRAEIDYAKNKLIELGKQGEIAGDQVALGLTKIEQKAAQLPDALNPAQAAFNAMGIKTQEQLDSAAQSAQANFEVISKSGQAAADGIQQAYKLMLDATIATGDKAKIAIAQAKAASLGLEVQLDATGKATVSKLGEIQQAAIATQRTMSQVSRAETPSNPTGTSDGLAGQDFWEEFKAERAKINEATKARMSSAKNGTTSRPIGLSSIADSIPIAPQSDIASMAPMIASNFDIQGIEAMQPTEKKVLELVSGGKSANLEGTPEAVDAVDQMLSQLEMLKRGM